ncbi:MAG: glycosyltransferase family 4 protein [Sulfuricaulis sp.]|uniref:glycosyltransferase family 4 protein n=1 Tax=Sulfuricaulis sp. TaxID=2003553 RepID=UPI0034A31F8B
MGALAIVILTLGALVISVILTRRFCDPNSSAYILDHPNERSLHDRPVPRGGGLAILIAIGASGSILSALNVNQDLAGIGISILLVAGISFIDDRYSIFPIFRLVVHVAAAAVVLYSGFILTTVEFPGFEWNWPIVVGAVILVLFVTWMINLYNFMDGMDGLAGGMSVIGFGFFAMMGWITGHEIFLSVSLITAAATAGFLAYNFPPARIFMGDVGSSTLGLLAATLSLWGSRDGVFPFWIGILVFSPFIMDATVTLSRRLLRNEKVWQAHKTHFYQLLVQSGWGHRRTLLLEYAIMLGCGLSALWGRYAAAEVQISILIGWILFYLAFFYWVSGRATSDEKAGI